MAATNKKARCTASTFDTLQKSPSLQALTKKHEAKHATFYDNDVNRSLSGHQTWSFNRGLTPEQHDGMEREGIDYLMVQNAKKPKQTTTQTPTYFVLGGRDMETFCKFLAELAAYYEHLENTSTNMEHSAVVVQSYIAESMERKRRSANNKKNKQPPQKKKSVEPVKVDDEEEEAEE